MMSEYHRNDLAKQNSPQFEQKSSPVTEHKHIAEAVGFFES